jgi:GT2 family glycosyltransferase/tetratricopeptide (TPR) repeat protein
VSRYAFDGSSGDWQKCEETARVAGAEVKIVNCPSETLHRRTALAEMRKLGFTHAIIPDSDEVLSAELLETLIGIARARTAERVACYMDTYWRSSEYVVRPREKLTPVILLDLEKTKHVRIREFTGGRSLVLSPDFGVIHHLSYAGSDARILRKINSWGHRNEVLDGFFQRSFIGSKTNPLLRDLHPTHPPAYKQVEHIHVPAALAGIPLEIREPLEPFVSWPTVSIVIALYGGETDIRLCLESLALLRDLIHEIVVVDDVSPDNAAAVAESFQGVILHRNETNLGFSGTNNVGFSLTTGKVVLFLNSDTVVPRAGLIRLIESLMASHNIAAAGPVSNNTGHHQQIDATYESLETMPLFAGDLAHSDFEDQDVDMLVGFCLAVRREVLDEIGLFDTRFPVGMFEDNDLCHRMRRSGFRLVLSRQAFVHHAGSRSLARKKEHPAVRLSLNKQIYLNKWKADLECGYVNHLAGMSSSPMIFNEANKPEEIDKRLKKLAKRADVCLCMIVKNEERILAECLESVKHGFAQTVIVDTGSTDGTKEIALRYGVELHEMTLLDSFSDARNYSLSFARTRFIMWMDADDTISRLNLERILLAVIHAKADIGGFIVPVRFMDGGPTGGTQVDHVKVFPNKFGIHFEGYIHEQVLPSIRAAGLQIARIKDAVVFHSGYDVSVAGQISKRKRDEPLLLRDHKEDPTHPFKMWNLGMTLHHLRQHEEAIDWFTKCLAASHPEESHVRKTYALLGVSRRELGDLEAALATFNEGLAITPEDPELLFESASTLSNLGRLDEAKARYLAVPSELSGHFSSIDIGILSFRRFHNLGTICVLMGHYAEGKAWWKKAIEVAPSFSPSPLALFDAALTNGDIKGGKEALDALLAAEGPTEGWALRLARLAVETGQDPEGMLRGALHSYPYAMGLLTVLSRMLLEKGDDNGAAPMLDELSRLGSAEGAYFRGLVAIRRLDLVSALEYMIRARELNPFHEPTATQICELRKILLAEMPPALAVRGEAVLRGPHIGTLGPGSDSVSVVVVTYNSVCTIGECAERVLASLGASDELILVDNASRDGTPLLLAGIAETDPRVKVILNEQNLGYSKAMNAGILSSVGKTIVTLNPDAYVNPGWVKAMQGCLKKGVAAVGPMSDNIGGDQFVGHLLGGRHPSLDALSDLLTSEFKGKSQKTKFLVGICVMVRRETLDKYGLLDEGTELGADDLEFSWRMRMLGFKLAIAQDVFVQHEQGVSFASLPGPERGQRQRRSDAALLRKLETFYGDSSIPSSDELWGTPIFDEAFYRFKVICCDAE